MKILTMMFLFMTANSAWADDPKCDFTLSLPNATVQPTNSLQTLQQTFNIEREDPSNGNCSRYRIYFGKGFANDYQRKAYNSLMQAYNYNLHQNSNLSGILKERNDALNPSEYVSGNSPNRQTTYQESFFLALPALSSQTNQKAGQYLDVVQLSIYRIKNNDELEFEKSQNFNVLINIPVALNISLVNEGDPFNINATSKMLDFGILEVNQELGADIIVNSNTPYQVKVSSFNNGKMVLGTSQIGYQLNVNGTNINLATSKTSPVTMATGTSPTIVAGTRFNAKIKIMSIPANPETGVYTDSITITAIAN